MNMSWAVTCKADTCTFEPYQSIAVVSNCTKEDVSSVGGQYLLPKLDGIVTLAIGVSGNSSSVAIDSTKGYPSHQPFGAIGLPLAQTGIIVDRADWNSPLGMLCVFYWADQDLDATISQNTSFNLVERARSTSYSQNVLQDQHGYYWNSSEGRVNGTFENAKNPNGSGYTISLTFLSAKVHKRDWRTTSRIRCMGSRGTSCT